MDEIKEEDNYSILTDYDDGVVCFGKETESQRERRKRLPRHTVLPSDIQLINKSLVNSYKNDEDYENDQSTSIMDNSGKSTSMPIDDPINDVTETTNFLENKEATRTIQLKQSSPNNSSYETFSDQNKSVFAEDETVSYIDVQEAELSTNNCVYSETSSSKSSVSSVIEKSVINNHKIPDRDDNICTLKHCSQQEDEDISYCCDSELEDNDEYSIVADKYSITPGKQRLFDSRHAKLSIRAKTIVTSAPFMDKIEETTTPLLKTPSSSPMLINDVSYEPLENEDGVYRTSVTSLDQKSSAVNFNQTSCVWDLKSKKSIDENMGESSKSTNCNYSVSKRVSKPSIVDMESSLFDTTIEETCENKLQNNFPPTNIETKIDFNMPLKVVNETLNTSNISEHIFDADKSINNMSNVEFPMAAINNFNNETTSEVVLAEIKNSVGNDTMSTTILNTNGKDKNLKKSFDETSQTKNILNVTKLNFDIRKSTTSMSNIVVRTADINGYNNEEESELMEVDIKSTNTSIVDTIFDETMCTSMLSLNDKSKHFDNSSNEISQDKYISKVAEKSFGNEKSMNVMSNINVSAADINDYNYEVKSVVEDADIKSSNSSIVDKIFDETMCTSMLSLNDKSKHFDNSSNEISQDKDILKVAEKSFGNEKSMNVMSNINVSAADINDYNYEVKSVVEDADIKSSNSSIVDKIFDETMCTSMLSSNNKSKHLDNSSNEISQAEDTSNVAEKSFDNEKSMNIMPNKIAVPAADVNDYNNEEKSEPMEVDIKSSNSSIVDKIFDETMCTSMLSLNDKSKHFDNSSNEISQDKDILKVAEKSFGNEKSMNVMSNINVSAADINDYNYEVKSVVEDADIKSSNSSIVDKIFDETMCTSMLSLNDKSKHFDNSSNEISQDKDILKVAEKSFGNEKSMNVMSNINVSAADINDYNYEVKSVVEDADIKSSNSSIVDKIFDETMCTSMLSSNNKSKHLDNSSNEISQAEDTSNVAEKSFDNEKSMNIMPNKIAVPAADVNDYNNEEKSEPMEVDIKSTDTSIVDKIFDETMCTSMLSLNDKSKHFDNPSNEISQNKDNSNFVKLSINYEKSIIIMPNIIFPIADVNDSNNEEKSIVEEANVISSNSSIVDKIFDETMCTSMLSSNDKSKHFDNSSNEISQDKDISKVAEKSFGHEKSMNVMSNINVSAADINDYNYEVKSVVEDADIKSSNSSIVDKIFDETMCTSMLSSNDKSKHFDNSSNEISQDKDISKVVEKSFGNEKSMNVMSNINVSVTDINDYNNEVKSVVEDAHIKSSNSSIVDKIFDETMHTSILATYNIYDDSNKSSNEISQAKDTLKVAEHSFDVGKSLDNTDVLSSNIKESILLSKSRDNILKYSENIEIPCSEKMDLVFSNEISKTNDNTSEDISRGMRQYLEFEQNIYDKCNDILSENCDTNVDNKSNTYSDQTLDNISMIEQILCSDSFISMKDNDNLSSSDNSLRPQLSVIIENRTLEENYCDMEQNENFEDPINDLSTTSVSKCNINEIQDDEKLNKSTNPNKMEYIFSKDVSKSELNQTDNKFEIKNKSNKGIFIINNIDSELILNENNKATYDTISDDKMDKTEPNKNLMLNDELSKTEPHILAEMENFLNNKSIEHCLVSKDVKEMCLNQNTLNKNDLTQILIQENMTNNHDFTTIECTQESENIYKNSFDSKQEAFSNNDFQQHNLLSTDKNIHDNSLDEFNKLEHMCNFEEDKKLQTFDYMTPKIQKLLDFSIMQQSPNYVNQIKNQKLLNFSIVDQTPLRKSIQPTNLDEKIIGKKNTLIDFSAVDQMWDLDVASPNKMISKNDLLNSSKDSLLENLSAISAPDFELLADKSILTNSSNHNNLSLNQTITDTNLNLSTNLGKINESKNNIDKKNTEEPNVKSSDKENLNCSMLLNNEQINSNEPTSSLDKTIEQIDLELNYTNKSCNKLCLDEITGAKYQSTCLSNTSLNQSFKNPDSTDFIMDSNQQSIFNSNLCAIKDFSIIEEQSLQIPKLKDNTNSLVVGSDLNVSNLIEMSAVSKIDIKSNDQALVSSDNPVIVVTSEKSINSSSSENNTAIHFEEHIFSHNHEFLTDIQMNDVSLIESSEKSSVGESFHSIESDQLQEDNKRKTEPDQEHHNHEKKMKVATEEPRTPMSMLYKLRNMFKSSEKPPIIKSNTNENDLKSDKCYQKLNLSNVEENKNKSICYKKPEVLIKSKIPCKVSDKSMLKNCDFNNSSLSLNESIKPKKAIPRFIGTPVLSDVSNSSNRKCPESRIPSKFKK